MASEHWVTKGGKEFFSGYKADVYKRHFYFGSWLGIEKPTPRNHRRADKAVLIFAATFEEHRAGGAEGWTTKAEQAARLAAMRAFGFAPALPRSAAPVTPTLRYSESAAVEQSSLTLHAAVDAYVERQYQRAASGQITDATVDKVKFSLARFKKCAEDRPLSAWTFGDGRSTVDYFAGRPKKANGQRIADQTAADTIVAIRAFFGDAIDRSEWNTPNLAKAFSFKRENLLTETELDAKGVVKTFTLDELRTLYRFCNNTRARLHFLLALNCGFTQKEIATLRLSHIQFDRPTKSGGKVSYIKRRRHKTKVWGKWWLWNETRLLLKLHLATNDEQQNPHALALLSNEGNPLVGKNIKGPSRYDLIRGFWQKQLDYANIGAASRSPFITGQPFAPVRPLGFKYLRKTASQLIRNVSDKDTSEAFLAQPDKTMGRAYNNANMNKLLKALRKVRVQLEPMFAEQPIAVRAVDAIDYAKRKPKNRPQKARPIVLRSKRRRNLVAT
jgi:integrase